MSVRFTRRTVLGAASAGAGLALLDVSPSFAQATPDSGAWSFVDDRGRTISLEQQPTRIVAEVMAAYALWEYGIKPLGIIGYLSGMEFPAEWDDVARFDQEIGIDVEALKLLDPDVMIGLTWEIETKNDFGGVDESTMPEVFGIAPTICILAVVQPIDVSITRFAELAAALGGSDAATPVADQKAAFEEVSERIKAAAAAKPDLTTMAISPTEQLLYVGNPSVSSELVYLVNLGVNFYQPDPTMEYASGLWEEVSWELAIERSADLYFTDNRVWALPKDELLAHPVFSLLPAAQAGQVYDWPVEFVFTYSALTPWLVTVAEALETAEIVTG